MSPKRHQSIRRPHTQRPANIPVLIMRPRLNDDIIDAEYDDESLNSLSTPAGQQLHDLFKKIPRDEYTPPPPNMVPARPWQNKNMGWTNSPSSGQAESQTGQTYLDDAPQFIHLEENFGNGLKGAFLLSRRSIIIIFLMFTLMVIGAQCVPDVLEIIFSFI